MIYAFYLLPAVGWVLAMVYWPRPASCEQTPWCRYDPVETDDVVGDKHPLPPAF